MNINPLISVIIPTYNRGKIISRTIQSVINQDYPYWQLIIIDDGSNDETELKIKKFLTDSRIEYDKKNNAGASAARNCGLKRAKGEYVTFLDSDDEYYPDRLSSMIRAINRYQTEIAVANRLVSYEQTRKNISEKKENNQVKLCRREDLIKNRRVYINILLKSEIAKQTEFDPSLPSSNDYDFVLRATSGKKIVYLDKIVYLVHKNSKENRLSANYTSKILGLKKIIEKIEKGSYNLTKEEEILLKRNNLRHTGLFQLLGGDLKEGRTNLKKSFRYGNRFGEKIKYGLIYILSYNFFLLKICLKIANKLWGIGLIKI